MLRPGVEYWASGPAATHLPQPVSIPSHHSASLSSSSRGPPTLSRTSTADYYSYHTPSDYAQPPRTSPTTAVQQQQEPHYVSSSLTPLSSSPRTGVSDTQQTREELEAARKRIAELQHHQQLQEAKSARLQSVWTRERLEHASALQAAEAALSREGALRAAAEQERQSAVREGQQLRAALRALLAQPACSAEVRGGAAASPSYGTSDAVPLVLYEEARRLLLRCERVFAELKSLQLRATDAAGLELLRRYSVPVLEDIPPAWPPTTPPKAAQRSENRQGDGTPAARAATCSPVGEVTPPAGPEVSVLTTVSPDTPYTPEGGDRSVAPSIHQPPPHPSRNESRSYSSSSSSKSSRRQGREEEAARVEADTVSVDVAKAICAGRDGDQAGGDARHTESGGARKDGGARRVLLSPAMGASPAKTADTAAPEPQPLWSGPMHQFAAAAASAAPTQPPPLPSLSALTAARLRPEPGAVLSEYEREDVIRDTDRLVRQLSHETAALARSQGLRRAADVAALCHRRGLDYVDAAFLPVTASLGLASGSCRGYDPERGVSFLVQWCRPPAFLPREDRVELLTSTGVDPCALRCGTLKDGGVVAALAALAEAAGAVTSVLASTTSEDVQHGLYAVWLCVRGWWTRVTVDAYLPCVVGSDGAVALYGCRNATAPRDLWAPVCEKALAKVYGSYQALLFVSAEVALAHLTGGPVESWSWWRRRSDAALAEMEAAINTNARGAGVVMLTTYSASALADASRANVERTRRAYERLGLRPGAAYRVLAVAENDAGEAMLLLRNWTAGAEMGTSGSSAVVGRDGEGVGGASSGHAQAADRRDVSPLREDVSASLLRLRGSAESGGEGGCLWMHYHKDVVTLFDQCHVCFDCRRYHDARFPLHFVGSAPAVPRELIRVRVLQPRRGGRSRRGSSPSPTRLWIGLHQPASGGAAAADGRSAWRLKMTLVGVEEAPTPFPGAISAAAAPLRVRPAQRAYILSESFLGEPQQSPAVWMYIELDPDDFIAAGSGESDAPVTAVEFFIVPQMERVDGLTLRSGGEGTWENDGEHHHNSSLERHTEGTASAAAATMRATMSSRRDRRSTGHSSSSSRMEGSGGDGSSDRGSSCFAADTDEPWHRRASASTAAAAAAATSSMEDFAGARTTAVVAVLAEEKESLMVDVVAAPAELPAALFHDVVDRLDFSDCVPLAGRQSPQRVCCQLNGCCLPHYAWSETQRTTK